MQTDPTELLDSFSNELYNKGEWRWSGENGSKARVLTAIQKMLKAGMHPNAIKSTIIELESVFYVEHEKQVKDKTGLSVKDFMLRKLSELESAPVKPSENKNECLCSSTGGC